MVQYSKHPYTHILLALALLFPSLLLLLALKGLADLEGAPECLNSGSSLDTHLQLTFGSLAPLTGNATLLHDLLVLSLEGLEALLQLIQLLLLLGVNSINLLILILTLTIMHIILSYMFILQFSISKT